MNPVNVCVGQVYVSSPMPVNNLDINKHIELSPLVCVKRGKKSSKCIYRSGPMPVNNLNINSKTSRRIVFIQNN